MRETKKKITMNTAETANIKIALEGSIFFFFEKTVTLYIFLIELQKLAGNPSSAFHVSLFVLRNTANLDNELLVYLINKELQSPKRD